MAQRTVWLDVVERLNEALGSYEIRIQRGLVEIAMGRPQTLPHAAGTPAPQQAYAYRVELMHNGVLAAAAGLDQPEVVLPQLFLRVLSHVNVERVGSRPRTDGYEAFQAAVDATRLERGIVDRAPGDPGPHEEED